MNKLPADQGIKIFDMRLRATTAGPSPNNNERVELFMLGCKKAMGGDACHGCFNAITWDANKAEFSWDPVEVAERINQLAPSKYITIGGGEPTDDLDNLIVLCRELKVKYKFNIMVYTWRDLIKARKGYTTKDMSDNNNKYPISTKKLNELLQYIDILVDGEFDPNQCLYNEEAHDGFLSSIGSGNQKIWDVNNMNFEYMKDLKGLTLDVNNNLRFIKKEEG